MSTTQTKVRSTEEALKLALEALNLCPKDILFAKELKQIKSAIAAIKEALAQPEQRSVSEQQEPVAWMNPYGGVSLRLFTGLEKNSYTIPLYTTPPQRDSSATPLTWVGLTKDQMLEILREIDPETQRLPIGFRMFADAIEAKLKEKNNVSW